MYSKDTLRVKFVNDARNYNDVLNNLILKFENLYSYVEKIGYSDLILSGKIDLVNLYSMYKVAPQRIIDYLGNYDNSVKNIEILEFNSKTR